MRPKYFVLTWDFNRDTLEEYDIMPYIFDEWNDTKPRKRPKTFEETKEWIRSITMYQFWARCQYEIIVTGFLQKNHLKIDVFKQIEMNLDIITKLFYEAKNNKV